MEADIVLRGGLVVDGSGHRPFHADVAVDRGRIVAVTKSRRLVAMETLDVRGLVVAPGFIDVHTHSDLPLFACPAAHNSITQGVTTELVGNCGASPAPKLGEARRDVEEEARELGVPMPWRSFGEYLAALDRCQPAINVAALVGHCTLRAAVVGLENRPPTPREQREMEALARSALKQGAFGLSTGLFYAPGNYADVDEIVGLARQAAARGALYATHIRHEGCAVVASVEEALEVARCSGVRLEISHHKSAGRRNWGLVRRTLALIHRARREGLDVGVDVYPYRAYHTGLSALLPPWVHAGGMKRMLARLCDPPTRTKIARELQVSTAAWENSIADDGWRALEYTSPPTGRLRAYDGLRLSTIARRRGQEPAETLFGLLREGRGRGEVIGHVTAEADMRRVLADPLSVVASDGWTSSWEKPLSLRGTHPRSFGTFARILARYVRETPLLSLASAVRKMTGEPARRIGLKDRGLVRVGYLGDLVVFNPDRILDRATYRTPQRRAAGIHHVLVHGTPALRDGELTGLRAGAVLRAG